MFYYIVQYSQCYWKLMKNPCDCWIALTLMTMCGSLVLEWTPFKYSSRPRLTRGINKRAVQLHTWAAATSIAQAVWSIRTRTRKLDNNRNCKCTKRKIQTAYNYTQNNNNKDLTAAISLGHCQIPKALQALWRALASTKIYTAYTLTHYFTRLFIRFSRTSLCDQYCQQYLSSQYGHTYIKTQSICFTLF